MADTTQKIENTETTARSLNNSLEWNDQGVRVPGSEDTLQRNYFAELEQLQNATYSKGDIFRQSAKHTFEDTTVGAIRRIHDIYEANKTVDKQGNPIDNPLLTPEEANAKFAQYGVTFNAPVRQNEAAVIAAQKIRETDQRERLQYAEHNFSTGAVSLMGGFAGAMLDPVNIATAFIPVTKVIPALKAVEASGAVGRIATKGLDGIIMNSIVEPLPLIAAGLDQRDYTMADSLFNIAAGGLFGAGIGGFVEGVRALGAGELFNANIAAATDFANNRGIENIKEFQRKNPTITSLAYDDLVELPESAIKIITDNNRTYVRLNDNGPLSELVGVGKNLDDARADLRHKLGWNLNDDSMFKGYRLDDGVDRLFLDNIRQSGLLAGDLSRFSNWLETLGKKADKAGVSLEDYLAKATDNFTNFEKVIKRAAQSNQMQIRFGELTGDALDDAIEDAAKMMEAMTMLKDALKARPRNGATIMSDWFGNLQERHYNQEVRMGEFSEMDAAVQELRNNQTELKNQLDISEDLTERAALTKQINDLTASINRLESEINNFKLSNDIDGWKIDAESIDKLQRMRAKLEEDPRTFDDVKDQLMKQARNEDGYAWDTSNSILDDMTFEDRPVGDEAHISQLEEEISVAVEDIKSAMVSSKFTKEELAILGLDKDGSSIEMKHADKRIEQMQQFKQDADGYVECRRTEAV